MGILVQCWFEVREGDPAFVVSGNACNYFRFGDPEGKDAWLEGRIVRGEFIFNGLLFHPNRGPHGTIIDNFPKTSPDGWVMYPEVDKKEYDLRSRDGKTTIFGFRVENRHCLVTVNIYNRDGSIIAEGRRNCLILRGGVPQILGAGVNMVTWEQGSASNAL